MELRDKCSERIGGTGWIGSRRTAFKTRPFYIFFRKLIAYLHFIQVRIIASELSVSFNRREDWADVPWASVFLCLHSAWVHFGRARWLAFFIPAKPLCVSVLRVLQLPRVDQVFWIFYHLKQAFLEWLWVKFNLELLKLTGDKTRSQTPVLKNEGTEDQRKVKLLFQHHHGIAKIPCALKRLTVSNDAHNFVYILYQIDEVKWRYTFHMTLCRKLHKAKVTLSLPSLWTSVIWL